MVKNLNILKKFEYLGRNDNCFSWWKIGHFSWKLKNNSDEMENFFDRIHDPQTSNQIDAAD